MSRVQQVGSLQFGGSADYVDCGSDVSIDFGGSDPLTAMVWASLPSTAANDDAFLHKGAFPTTGWHLSYFNIGPHRGCEFNRQGGTDNYIRSTGAYFNEDDSWNFIVVQSLPGGSAAQNRYFFGRVAGAAVQPSYLNQNVGASGTSDASSSLRVGDVNGGLADFDGKIALVALFKRILTPREIRWYQVHGLDPSQLWLPRQDPTCRAYLLPRPDGSLVDVSGNGNHGTVTGTVVAVADHPYYRSDVSYIWMPTYLVSAGGAALTAVRGETVNLSEDILRALGLVRGRDETVELSEDDLRALGITRVIDETAQLAEDTDDIRGLSRDVGDTAELAEDTLDLRGITRTQSENVSLTEGVLRVLGLRRIRDAALTLGEDVLRLVGLVRARADSLPVAESPSYAAGYVRTRDEAIELSEGLLRVLGLARTRADTVNIAETPLAIRGLTVIRSETLSLVETLAHVVTVAGVGFLLAAIRLFPALGATIGLDPALVAHPSVRPTLDATVDLGPEDGS